MSRFQEFLYNVVITEKPLVAVETGYANGLSAMHILAAMDANGFGKLYSVESFTNQDIFHPRLEYVRGFSSDKMSEIFIRSGPWDLFLHDSDHDVGCATFEYELAWHLTKPGGIIMSDDYEWGDPPHFAWRKFLARHDHDVRGVETIGSAQYIQKPATADAPGDGRDWTHDQFIYAALLSNKACVEYGVPPYFPELTAKI